jgi:RNA recognition motif-containing protein
LQFDFAPISQSTPIVKPDKKTSKLSAKEKKVVKNSDCKTLFHDDFEMIEEFYKISDDENEEVFTAKMSSTQDDRKRKHDSGIGCDTTTVPNAEITMLEKPTFFTSGIASMTV